MPAAMPGLKAVGLKAISGAPGKRKAVGAYFVILLYDSEGGELISVMNASYLTAMRTGAASAVATRALARRDARIVGLFGAGVQGEAQLKGVCEVRPIEQIKVYDLDRDKGASFCERVSEALAIPVLQASSREEVVAGSDVVITATTSTEPVFRDEWLGRGAHINAIGANAPSKREIDGPTFRRSKIVVDFREQVLAEGGDLIDAIQKGHISEGSIHAELGEILVGRKTGRSGEDEVTLFKSVGIAITDVACAARVYRVALEKGVGRDVQF